MRNRGMMQETNLEAANLFSQHVFSIDFIATWSSYSDWMGRRATFNFQGNFSNSS